MDISIELREFRNLVDGRELTKVKFCLAGSRFSHQIAIPKLAGVRQNICPSKDVSRETEPSRSCSGQILASRVSARGRSRCAANESQGEESMCLSHLIRCSADRREIVDLQPLPLFVFINPQRCRNLGRQPTTLPSLAVIDSSGRRRSIMRSQNFETYLVAARVVIS